MIHCTSSLRHGLDADVINEVGARIEKPSAGHDSKVKTSSFSFLDARGALEFKTKSHLL